MYKKPSNFKQQQLIYAIEFAKGKMTVEEYLKLRLKDNWKWYEMTELVKEPFLFQMFLNRLQYNYRPKVLKEVQGLKNHEIRGMRGKYGFSGQVDNYLKGDFQINYEISLYLYELAIIFDVPIEMLMYESPLDQYVNLNSFSEYKKLNRYNNLQGIKKLTLERPNIRNIIGFIVKEGTSYFDFEYYARIDRRVEFFSFEIFVPSIVALNKEFIDKFLGLLDGKVKNIFYSKALLRDVYKVFFIGCYDQNPYHLEIMDSLLPEIKERYNAIDINPV
jgi:hypothetical protein